MGFIGQPGLLEIASLYTSHSDYGLGPVRYMTISVQTTSVHVYFFGICKWSTISVYTTSVH